MHSLCNTWSYIILYETWFWHKNYQHITSVSYSLFVLINMKPYFTLFVYIFTVSQACASPISKRKFMTSSHQILNSQFRISNLSDWSKVCFDAIKKTDKPIFDNIEYQCKLNPYTQIHKWFTLSGNNGGTSENMGASRHVGDIICSLG